jgi:hypothetical protein
MAREHAYDIELNSQGFITARDVKGKPDWEVDNIEAEDGQTSSVRDMPSRIETCHLGGGFGRSEVQGGYHYALGMDCSEPGVVLMGPLVTILTCGMVGSTSDLFEQNGKLYVLGGRYCKRIDPSDDTVKTPDAKADGKDFGAGLVPSEAVNFIGNAYIGFSTDHPIWKFTGTDNTNTWDNLDPDTASATAVRAKYWAKDYLDGYGWRLWAAYSTQYVKGCDTNPLQAADWGPASPYSVGDTSTAITDMIGVGNRFLIPKTDGLYAMDYTGRYSNVMESVETLVAATNGANSLYYNGRVLYPHVMGLLEYDRSSEGLRTITPWASTGNQSPVKGRITAQAALGLWHYVAMYDIDAGKSYILKGRFPSSGEGLPNGWVGPMIWHGSIVSAVTGQITCMHISGLTSPPRLWFGVGTDVGYIRIPQTGSVLAEVANMRFGATGSLYFTPQQFRQPAAPKEVILYNVQNEGISAANSAQLFMSFDGGAYSAFGSPATAASLSRIPRPATGTWRGYNVVPRLDVANSTATLSPKYLPIVGRAAIRPENRTMVTTTLLCQDEVRRLDGSIERKTGKYLLDVLEAAKTSAPVMLKDWWTGSSRTRTVIVHSVQEMIVQQQGKDAALYGAKVQFSVISEP